ncbi:MAG TPA: molybdopterin-synthase adenylyltransferase MoeB [Candidatus Nanopelagicaceae bacterium]
MTFPPVVQLGRELTVADERRYSRQLVLPEIGKLGQQRISNAKVLCVGAGGLGSPVLLYLAAAGVGTLGVVDFDEVDESNLQRQVIHGQSDIGRKKVESAKAKIHEINPAVTVDMHHVQLDASNVLEIFSCYDIIVDGTDNFATRYLINDACVVLNKPCVMGSIFRFDGQASVFWSAHGPCYRCVYPKPPPKGLVPNCAQSGVLGALCGFIGAIQATETLKLITGIGSPLVGSLVIYDGLESSYDNIKIAKDPDCVLCADTSKAQLLEDYEAFCGLPSFSSEITAEQLAARIHSGEAIQLIDVREEYEWDEFHIEGAVLIPQAEFYDGRARAKILKDQPIVLYCHLGIRSAHALNVLKQSGYKNASHLLGGIDSWNEYKRNG